jgi:hypothetical protein
MSLENAFAALLALAIASNMVSLGGLASVQARICSVSVAFKPQIKSCLITKFYTFHCSRIAPVLTC